MFDATETDKIIRQKESAKEFESSSALFLAADNLRYKERLYAEAENKYREAMEATGSYGVYYHLAQGQIYSMRGNLDYALTEFEIAAEINEQLPLENQAVAVFINLALTYRKLSGRYSSLNLSEKAEEMLKESIGASERALEIAPSDIGALNALAKTYLKVGKKYLDAAEELVEKAYNLDPQSYEALCGLAQVRRSQERKEEAKQFAQSAIKLRPNQPFAYGILGGLRDNKKERLENSPKIAIEWLEKGLALEPDNSFTLSELGKAYRELGEHPTAVEYFEAAVEKDSEGEQKYGSLTNRGNAYRQAGNKENDETQKAEFFKLAEADLKKALSIRENFNPALIGLRDLYQTQKRYEEAYQIAGQLNLENEKNKQTYEQLARQYENARRESKRITEEIIQNQSRLGADEAKQKAQEALRLDSQNSDAWWLAGRCLFAGKDYDEGRRYFEQAVALNPRRVAYRLALGKALEQLKDWQAAEREYSFYVANARQKEQGEEGLRRVRKPLRRDERRQKAVSAKSGAGPEIVFINNQTGRKERHSIETIRNFLYDRINDWNLPIKDIIEEIGDEPVFIIAKTGVGKTVTVPTKVLLGLCDDLLRRNRNLARKFPQVFVVEPRIPICTMMMAEMNDGYQDYLAYKLTTDAEFCDFLVSQGIENPKSKEPKIIEKIVKLAYEYAAQGRAAYNPRHFNLYGCITSAGKINGDAPILFVTTGIMESLTFDGDELDADYHRIIIDEAHVTIEANPAIELGIALARKRGVKIDYMSATVDPATLAEDLGVKIIRAGKSRFPIYLTNLKTPVEERVLELVENYLLEPNAARFPDPNDFDAGTRDKIEKVRLHLISKEDFTDDGKNYPGLNNRAQGMLIIVNSHQNENSDTQRIANLITRADFNKGKTRVEVLRLASPIVRDPAQKLAFDKLVKNIEDKKGRYVIVATNVVEMGLTFSTLDYVVTMDSEFDNEYTDGSQMVRRVELGINALYQRIGRAGRVRPGMAFIAKDFGAWYSEIDDATLARGLTEAPIKYPLAKGSFLKLALHTFRSEIPEQDLRREVERLNLPSKIQDSPELWSRFVAERERLRKIGIADGDKLTPSGKKTFDFVGLEDMDFAALLASVMENNDEKSSLPIIFAVFAAASDFGFADFMDRKFFLTNPKQLSALEIIHEDALGIPIEQAYEIIKRNENNPCRLFEALRGGGADERVCQDIFSFAEAGYKLVGKRELERESGFFQNSPEEFDDDANYFADEEISDDAWDEEIEEDLELPDEVKIYLDHGSTERTLAFERAVVGFSDQSEIINTYRIFSYFYNNYFSLLNFGTVSPLEASEIRLKMAEEASKLQLNAKTLGSLNDRFTQLLKHVGIKFRGGSRPLAAEVEFGDKDAQILRDVIIKELLFERDRADENFDLCRKFFDLVERRKPTSRGDYESIAERLGNYGFSTNGGEVEELWYLIIKEAKRRFEKEIRGFGFAEYPAHLPFISRGLEKRILEILRENGHHRRLTFNKTNYGFETTVEDQNGEPIKVVLPDENTPLESALEGKETVTVFAKLTPRLVEKDARAEDDGSFTKRQEKIFSLSHVTLLT